MLVFFKSIPDPILRYVHNMKSVGIASTQVRRLRKELFHIILDNATPDRTLFAWKRLTNDIGILACATTRECDKLNA